MGAESRFLYIGLSLEESPSAVYTVGLREVSLRKWVYVRVDAHGVTSEESTLSAVWICCPLAV